MLDGIFERIHNFEIKLKEEHKGLERDEWIWDEIQIGSIGTIFCSAA